MSEVKFWWADLDESPEENDISVGTLLREHPRQGPLNWQESLFPVVKKSDYDAIKQLSDAFYLKQVQLENQNEELKAKLEKAGSVISFYASEDTWINKEFDEKNNLIGWTQKKTNDVSIFPYSIGNSNGNFYCLGRRAREYMKGEG